MRPKICQNEAGISCETEILLGQLLQEYNFQMGLGFQV